MPFARFLAFTPGFFGMLWARLFEIALVIGMISAMFIGGLAVRWLSDNQPMFEEAAGANSYISPAAVPSGSMVIMHRKIRRLEYCPTQVSMWLLRDGVLFFHLDNFTGFAGASLDYRDFQLLIWLPPQVPPGHYMLRMYYQCQRNPLLNITQILRDLPIEVR